MTDPVTFTSTTARLELPYLIAGQAQKEMFVNEAFARLDALIQPVVEGTRPTPPVDPSAGECWIVAVGANGEWTGADNHLSSWDRGQWTLHPPFAGLHAFDRSEDRLRTYTEAGDTAPLVADPAGGSVIDSEARAAISAVLAILRTHRSAPVA